MKHQKLLGIDFGLKKIGLAIAESILAEPYMVLRYSDIKKAIQKIKEIVENEKIQKIVVGVSENQSKIEAVNFAKLLKTKIAVTIDFQDETLSTQEANLLAIEGGINLKKRKLLEDAFSASLILQRYIESSIYK